MSERQVASVNLLNRLNLCEPLVRKWRTHCECMSTDKPPKRPDLAIYSQVQRLSQGLTASWYNPDIQLLPEDILVIVHNESNECSAVNTLVEVKWAPLGIGTTFKSLGNRVVNLNAPHNLGVYFPSNDDVRALAPYVSIQVDISHPHDKDTGNNMGFHAHHIVRTSRNGRSPSMNFPVVNTSAAFETITLVVLANDIAATVTPAVRGYAPNEQFQATLSTIIPASISNTRESATVVGYDSSGKILGGVTLLVEVDS